MQPTLKHTFSDLQQIRQLALKIRYSTLLMVHRAGSSHIGTSFSMAELLAVLYGKILRVDPNNPQWPDRDRFVLSKGHGCASLYAVLADRGFFPTEWLKTFYQNGSRLAGHITHTHVPGVEVSTGSLGHGLSIATGLALAAKRDAKCYRVFALLSDGECDEGSTWESVLFAPQHRLGNLVAIIDYNKIQSLGHVKEVLDLEPFAEKWRSFGWAVREIDGHDVSEIVDSLANVPFDPGRPNCVIAHTVKGKGVSFMENKLLWHYRCPSDDELHQALSELSEQTNDSNCDLKFWT
jgi:transketolase